MNIGMNDTLPFGQYRGQSVTHILKSSPSGGAYLVWLREQRRKDGERNFFDAEVIDRLDSLIESNKRLQRQYKTFRSIDAMHPMAGVSTNQEAIGATPVAPEVREVEAEFAYAEQWGSF